MLVAGTALVVLKLLHRRRRRGMLVEIFPTRRRVRRRRAIRRLIVQLAVLRGPLVTHVSTSPNIVDVARWRRERNKGLAERPEVALLAFFDVRVYSHLVQESILAFLRRLLVQVQILARRVALTRCLLEDRTVLNWQLILVLVLLQWLDGGGVHAVRLSGLDLDRDDLANYGFWFD